MELAPIVLFVYNRLELTQKTIEFLLCNQLCAESELVIFSDGSRNESDKIKVEEVRQYIKSISGFKKITIKESILNKGLANSVISGVTQVFEKYDKVIVLEDDLLTAPDFLKFVNEALNFYKDDSKIWSITGYCPPIKIPKEYESDVFLALRPSSWGWGTWKNRWNNIDWEIKEYKELVKDKRRQREFNKGGNDLYNMLRNQKEGRIDSWAIRWSYNQFINSANTIYPVITKVQNIGFGNEATHTKKKRFQNQILDGNKEFVFNNELILDEGIAQQFKKLFMSRLKLFIKDELRKVGLDTLVIKLMKSFN